MENNNNNRKRLWLYSITFLAMIGFFFAYNAYFRVWNNPHFPRIFLIINVMYLALVFIPAHKFVKLSSKIETAKLQKLLRENGFSINDEEGVIGTDTEKAVKQLEEKRNRPFKTMNQIIGELKKMSKRKTQ